jgi:hypothetical protein
MERLVLVEQRLDPVAAGRNLAHTLQRIPRRATIEHGHAPGGPAADVLTENQLRLVDVRDLIPWLIGRVGGQQDEQPPVERRGALRPRVGDEKSGSRRGGRLGRERDGDAAQQQTDERTTH